MDWSILGTFLSVAVDANTIEQVKKFNHFYPQHLFIEDMNLGVQVCQTIINARKI